MKYVVTALVLGLAAQYALATLGMDFSYVGFLNSASGVGIHKTRVVTGPQYIVRRVNHINKLGHGGDKIGKYSTHGGEEGGHGGGYGGGYESGYGVGLGSELGGGLGGY